MTRNLSQDKPNNSGIALISVIIVCTVAMIVIVAGLTLSTTTSQSNTRFIHGGRALLLAETGAENALLRLLRDPNYQGEVLNLPDGTAKIEVTQANGVQHVLITGSTEFSSRQIDIKISYDHGMMKIDSWRESF